MIQVNEPGVDSATRIDDLLKFIERCFENKIRVIEGNCKAILAQGNEKIKSLGWKPEFDIEMGILKTVEYFKKMKSEK